MRKATSRAIRSRYSDCSRADIGPGRAPPSAPPRPAVQVFLSPDLPVGPYRGTLSLTPAGQSALEIPVELEVAR